MTIKTGKLFDKNTKLILCKRELNENYEGTNSCF